MHFISAILFIFVYVALLLGEGGRKGGWGGGFARRHLILFFSFLIEIVIYSMMAFIDDTEREIYMKMAPRRLLFCRGEIFLLSFSGIATVWTVTAQCIYIFSPQLAFCFMQRQISRDMGFFPLSHGKRFFLLFFYFLPFGIFVSPPENNKQKQPWH